MSIILGGNRRKNVIITDLDDDNDGDQQSKPERSVVAPKNLTTATHQRNDKTHHRKRQTEKIIHTISGSFNRRSHSADGNSALHNVDGDIKSSKTNTKLHNYFNDLLQTKDKQMDKLVQRLATLHKFNEQFADENRKLREDVEQLDDRINELHEQMTNCVNCQKLSQELTNSIQQNKILENDLEMMKTLVYRLNVQIECYQDQQRHAKQNCGANSSCDTMGLGAGGDNQMTSSQQMTQNQRNAYISDWQDGALNRHTLAPLLQAYDEMIRDKEQLIQQYLHEFEHFTGELKEVIEENNRLLQQNESLKKDMGTWREERARLQAALEVCREKAEAQTSKCDLAKEKLVEVMHCYEQKMQTLILEMEHIQTAYARSKTELASLRNSSQKSQPTIHIADSIEHCKNLLEELKAEHGKEKEKLERTIREITSNNHSYETKLEMVKQENSCLKKEIEKHLQEIESIRQRSDSLQRSTERAKRSRDRLKARLRIALQWAQKLEEGQTSIQNTWDALKRLETIVKHKESQVRGLQARHVEEIDKLEKKLAQKDETIRKILKGKLGHQ